MRAVSVASATVFAVSVAVLVAACVDAPIRSSPGRDGGQDVAADLDFDRFQSEIQPLLDSAGDSGGSCAAGGACHEGGAGGFTLVPMPAAESGDMMANYEATSARVDVDRPSDSLLIRRGTDGHSISFQFNQSDQDVLTAWIAGESSPGGGSGADGGTAPDAGP